MPVVSGFETLPAEHRAWLIREWRRAGYGDNERLARALGERLRADDPAATDPAASTLYRWARAEKARAGRIRYTAELRAATIAALPEDDPDLNAKVGAYMEGRLVEALEDLDALADLDPLERLAALTDAHKATTARRRVTIAQDQADLARQRFEAEQAIRADEQAKALAAATQAARGEGVSPAAIEAIRAAMMGNLA